MCRVDRNTAVSLRSSTCVYVCVRAHIRAGLCVCVCAHIRAGLCVCATSCSSLSQTLVIFMTRDSSLSLYMFAALLLHVPLFSPSSEHLGPLHLTVDLGTMWKPLGRTNGETLFTLCCDRCSFTLSSLKLHKSRFCHQGAKFKMAYMTLENYSLWKGDLDNVLANSCIFTHLSRCNIINPTGIIFFCPLWSLLPAEKFVFVTRCWGFFPRHALNFRAWKLCIAAQLDCLPLCIYIYIY